MKEKFGDKFTYEKTNVLTLRIPVIITCIEHGDFKSSPDTLLKYSSIACPTCRTKHRSILGKGRYQSDHLKDADELVKFYVVKFSNNTESFYKIGITSQKKLKYRFTNTSAPGYEIQPIQVIEMSVYEAAIKEETLLQECKQYKYTPKNKFSGWTECFSINPLKLVG